MRENLKKNIILAILFFLSVIIIDRFFIQGTISFPQNPKQLPDDKIYSYITAPFYNFTGKVPDFPSKGDWMVSHPIGIGSYDEIVSIEVPNPGAYSDLECQTFYDFSDGYYVRVKWDKAVLKNSKYYVDPERKFSFLQIRMRRTDRKLIPPSTVTVSVKTNNPIGIMAVTGNELRKAVKNAGKYSLDADAAIFPPDFYDKPLRVVKLDNSFETYNQINMLNGLGCNVIGEVNFDELNSAQAQECVMIYRDSIKIWKLTYLMKLPRESVETFASFIYTNSKKSFVLWEDEGLLPNPYERSVNKDWSPVKLNRGTLWTAVILFSLMFIIVGTVRLFDLGLHWDKKIIIRNLIFTPVLAFIFLLPLPAEGVKFIVSTGMIKLLLIGIAGVCLSEFVRCWLLRSGRDLLIKPKRGKKKDKDLKNADSVMIFSSALLISFLYAGYPGYSTAGSVLLVVSNFVAGIFLGYMYIRYKSLFANIVVHCISIIPFILLLGK